MSSEFKVGKSEHEQAADDAAQFGSGFMVDGVRVAPERVLVYGDAVRADSARKMADMLREPDTGEPKFDVRPVDVGKLYATIVTPAMMHEMDSHMPSELKHRGSIMTKWEWMANWMTAALARPDLPCSCCGISPNGEDLSYQDGPWKRDHNL